MENINIASFDFDDSKIYQKLDELGKQIEDLNVKREQERRVLNELNKEYNATSRQMDTLEKTGRKLTPQYNELVRKQNDITLSIVKQRQEISDITTETRGYQTEVKQLNLTLEQQERATQLLTNAYDLENKSIQQLRDDRKILLQLRNQEVAVMGEQSEQAQRLNKIIEESTNQEKKLVAETEKRFYQIGDYAGQLEDSFGGVINAIQQIGSGDVVGGVDNLKNSFGGLVQTAKAFIATPIGAVVTGLVAIGGATKYIYDYNVQMQEATKLTQQFTGLTGGELENASVRVKSFAEQTDTSMKEVIRTVNAVANSYGLTFDEAFDKVQKGYIRAGQSAEDFFDNTDEYIQQFKNAGYSADEFFSILEAGAENGTYKDKIVDTIKEMDLRLKEFTKASSDALTNAFGQDFTNKLNKGLASGTITTKQALADISKEADKVGLNFQQKQTLVADVFGAMGEDAGGFVKVLEAVESGLNNTDRELTAIEQAQQNVIDKTNEFDQAFADLFNATGGGFETMISDLKVIGLNLLIDVINKIKSIKNGFIEAYNSSIAFRGGINGIILAFKTLFNISTTVFSGVFEQFKTIGNLFIGIVTFDKDKIKSALENGYKNTSKLIKETVSNIAKDVKNASEEIKLGSISISEDTSTKKGGSTEIATGGKVITNIDKERQKELTKLASERLKEQLKQQKEAEKALEDAKKYELKLIEDAKKYAYDLGQNELTNQIKNNAEKLKNAKILTDEMLQLSKNLYAEEQKIEQQKIDAEKTENDRRVTEQFKASEKEIANLGVTQLRKDELLKEAENVRNIQLDLNNQAQRQKTLENETATLNAVKELQDRFREDERVLKEQRDAFELQQKMIRLENANTTEFDMQRIMLSQQYTQEMSMLREQLNNKIITLEQFSRASIDLETNRAKKEEEIERILNQQKMSIISDTLGGVADLLGKNTKAGKIAGSAQALINTWQGVTEVWKTPSTLPEPFATISKVGSTATVVASGMNALKQINKVSEKSINSAGAGTTASGGTTTNTYKASYAGGNTGLEGLSTLNQQKTFGSTTDTNAIAEAVKEGAKQGTQQGSKDGLIGLSTNRQIQSNASY